MTEYMMILLIVMTIVMVNVIEINNDCYDKYIRYHDNSINDYPLASYYNYEIIGLQDKSMYCLSFA